MYFVYVLQSISNLTRYVGQTDNVNKRLREHNSGKCRYSSGKRPWKLIYQEEYKSRSEAIKRERFLKSGQGRKYLDEVLKNKFGEVAEWSSAEGRMRLWRKSGTKKIVCILYMSYKALAI
jgi:putative endonuclease